MRRFCLALSVALLFVVSANAGLKEYVAQPDDAFRWEVRAQQKIGKVRCAELLLVSQNWHGHQWKHLLYIALPDDPVTDKHAMLLIGGADWKKEFDQPVEDPNKLSRGNAELLMMARTAKMPVAVLLHVPFQPMFDGRKEDQIIAYTFDKYLHTKDSTWPLLFPMVKSAVRAMDAVQQFAKKDWNIDIEGFTVAGASKRGWTTWLTGVVDPRVRSIVPIVIDTLNMRPQMANQLKTYGRYSEQIEDYTELKLQERMETPDGKVLQSMVDPYTYREDLKLPKLMVIGTNDRYWTLDALNLYWDGLEGEKRVLYVPNNGHDIQDLMRTLSTGTAMALRDAGLIELPNFEWDLAEDADGLTIRASSDIAPTQVLAWTASAPSRDFREAKWTSAPVESQDGKWVFQLPRPDSGCVAGFLEGKFSLEGNPAYLSTNLKILEAEPAATK